MNHVWDVLHALQAFLNPDRIIALLTLIVAAFGAWFAFRAPDKKDLKRVEVHTASTSAHLENQSKREEYNAIASRVSIKVEGRDFQDEPLQVHLTLQDPSVRLNCIDMLNTPGTLFGSGSCSMEDDDPTRYVAPLDYRKVPIWFNNGEHFGNTSHLWLRISMLFEDGGKGEKTMPVVLIPSRVGTEQKTGPVWDLAGEV